MKKKIFFVFWAICLIICCTTFSLKAEDVKTLEIGDRAPAFSLPGIDGKTYTLESFQESDILLVIFTANHCPTAQAYEDRILQLYSEFHLRGVGFVLISPNNPQAVCLEELGYSDLGDSFEDMKLRATEKHYRMPYLYDGDLQEMTKAYGPTTTPQVFIFDKSRILRFCGRIDDTENPYEKPVQQDTRNAITALMEGKLVPVEKTKTFGCSIKWSSKIDWRNRLDAEWKAKPVEIQEVNLKELKELIANKTDKYRLVNIWATWCGPCVMEFPEFIVIQRMYGARNFEFVSVSMDVKKNKENVLQFLKDKNAATVNYICYAKDQYSFIDAVDKNWPGAIPYTLLIAPGGEIVKTWLGMIDPLEVKTEIVNKLGRFFADDK
jgi:peroxiredoxin